MTLKTLRENSNLSKKKVADALQVTTQAISNYESGIRQINIRQVLILAILYDSTAEEIISAQLNSCR